MIVSVLKPVTHEVTSWLKKVGCNKLVRKSCYVSLEKDHCCVKLDGVEEMLCPVSPNVATDFFEQTPQMTCRVQLVASCVTGLSLCLYRSCSGTLLCLGMYLGYVHDV